MLDRSSSQPLYVQIRNILVSRLDSEQYRVNEQIPSEKTLCQEFGISRETLRSVLTELVREGRLYRVQGKGTFVAEPKITANAISYAGIRQQLEEQGYDVTTILLAVQTIACPVAVAKHLGISEEEPVYLIQRLRNVKDIPLSIHNSYIPKKLCPELEKNDFCNSQMCEILSRCYGLVRGRVTESLESVLAREKEAELLNIKKGHPLLKLSDIVATSEGTIFEYSTVVFRGDKIKIQLNFDI